MKSRLIALALVLCFVFSAALAENDAHAVFIGAWEREDISGIYALLEDSTLMLYYPDHGLCYSGTWTSTGNTIDLYFADSVTPTTLAFDAAADLLRFSEIDSVSLSRLSDDQFTAIVDKMTAVYKLDAVMEDYLGAWELTSVYNAETDTTEPAEAGFTSMSATITDDDPIYVGRFSLTPWDRFMGNAYESSALPCRMNGNALICLAGLVNTWSAVLRTDDVLELRLGLTSQGKYILYLTRADQ